MRFEWRDILSGFWWDVLTQDSTKERCHLSKLCRIVDGRPLKIFRVATRFSPNRSWAREIAGIRISEQNVGVRLARREMAQTLFAVGPFEEGVSDWSDEVDVVVVVHGGVMVVAQVAAHVVCPEGCVCCSGVVASSRAGRVS